MTDRSLATAVRERLGAEALKRLHGLRRRLWLRRSMRSATFALAGALIGAALVQLLARSTPLELAPLAMAAAAGLAFLGWTIDSWRRRPSLTETARRADAELGLRERLGTALELVAHHWTANLSWQPAS